MAGFEAPPFPGRLSGALRTGAKLHRRLVVTDDRLWGTEWNAARFFAASAASSRGVRGTKLWSFFLQDFGKVITDFCFQSPQNARFIKKQPAGVKTGKSPAIPDSGPKRAQKLATRGLEPNRTKPGNLQFANSRFSTNSQDAQKLAAGGLEAAHVEMLKLKVRRLHIVQPDSSPQSQLHAQACTDALVASHHQPRNLTLLEPISVLGNSWLARSTHTETVFAGEGGQLSQGSQLPTC